MPAPLRIVLQECVPTPLNPLLPLHAALMVQPFQTYYVFTREISSAMTRTMNDVAVTIPTFATGQSLISGTVEIVVIKRGATIHDFQSTTIFSGRMVHVRIK